MRSEKEAIYVRASAMEFFFSALNSSKQGKRSSKNAEKTDGNNQFTGNGPGKAM